MQIETKEALSIKINDLFAYRMFPELLSDHSDKREIWNKLCQLQTEIYLLDKHLEENWVLSKLQLEKCWESIHSSLASMGIGENQWDEYCAHIHKYELREKALRYGIFPLHLAMEYFYFYKSCDVKLCRRLIFEASPKIRKEISLADWRYFDLVTEVNDDVEDVFEDLETINGNRFLISIHQKGKKQTELEFISFLDEVSQKNQSRFAHPQNEWQEVIQNSTKENIILTKELLTRNLSIFTEDHLQGSKLFFHLRNKTHE